MEISSPTKATQELCPIRSAMHIRKKTRHGSHTHQQRQLRMPRNYCHQYLQVHQLLPLSIMRIVVGSVYPSTRMKISSPMKGTQELYPIRRAIRMMMTRMPFCT